MSSPAEADGMKKECNEAAENTNLVEQNQLQTPGETDSSNAVKEHVILEGTVIVSGKEKCLCLTSEGLKLIQQNTGAKKKNDKDLVLCWCDILRAKRDPKAPDENQHSSFELHYMHLCSNNTLRPRSLRIEDKGGRGEKWINAIQDQLHIVPGRPKKVFVIINPIGGSGRARQTYAKTVAPIFELAGLHTTVMFTERMRHATEIAETQALSSYDGIVVAGGDGLYQEVIQGLFVRAQKEATVDYNNPNAEFKKIDIPVGIIPTGTGNGASGWSNGVIDVETAALRVIRGKHYRAQMFTVHSDDKFVCISALVFAYGLFSDVIKRSEELRWMRRARYPYALMGMVVKKKRRFRCELSYRLLEGKSVEEGKESGDDGAACASQAASPDGWVTHSNSGGVYCGISAFCCDWLSAGDRCIIHPFGKAIELGIDTGCSMFSLFKYMMKFATGKQSTSSPANLEAVPGVTGMRIKLIRDETESDESVSSARAKERECELLMDIDGEVVKLSKPEMEVRLHPEFVPLYGVWRATVAEKTN